MVQTGGVYLHNKSFMYTRTMCKEGRKYTKLSLKFLTQNITDSQI
jgi:hypothetical protein